PREQAAYNRKLKDYADVAGRAESAERAGQELTRRQSVSDERKAVGARAEEIRPKLDVDVAGSKEIRRKLDGLEIGIRELRSKLKKGSDNTEALAQIKAREGVAEKLRKMLPQAEAARWKPSTGEQAVYNARLGGKPELSKPIGEMGVRPTTPRETEAKALSVGWRAIADEPARRAYADFERIAKNTERAVRLRPSADNPDTIVRRALEIGSSAIVNAGRGVERLSIKEQAALTAALESGFVTVESPSKPKQATPSKPSEPATKRESKITATIRDAEGKSKKITVYSDTPDGEWTALQDLMKEAAANSQAKKSKGKKAYSGVPIDAIAEMFSKGGDEADATKKAAVYRRLMDKALVAEAARAGGEKFRDNIRTVLSKVIGKPLQNYFLGPILSPTIKRASENAQIRRNELARPAREKAAAFDAALNKMSGGIESAKADIAAGAFAIIETEGKTQIPQATKYLAGEMGEVVKAGREFANAMLPLGKVFEDAGFIPTARYQQFGPDGEMVWTEVTVTADQIADGSVKLEDFNSNKGLEPGHEWKLIGGLEYSRLKGGWLKHQGLKYAQAMAQEMGRFLGGGNFFRGIFGSNHGLITKAFMAHMKRREVMDITGKEGDYSLSFEPTLSAMESEIGAAGKFIYLEELAKAGLAVKGRALGGDDQAAAANALDFVEKRLSD
ncbi:MAG: hypothetical protein ABL961_18530, partial [Vicinamibacterales bacterium]